jgi:stearoyl-CoA 9-desaturase NADPH oxidoreductase
MSTLSSSALHAGGGARTGASAVLAARRVAARLVRARQVDFWMRELVDPAWSLDALRARVVEVIPETHDVRTFVLAPNRLWPGHRAGQFVPVSVEVDGALATRCYSISSAPGDARVTITVKRVPGGRVSTWMHERVHAGDVLTLGRPAGDFVLNPSVKRKLLLLSGGSGVTPLMSILRDLDRRDAVHDVVFLHAARSRRDVVFARELELLAAEHPGLRVAYALEDDPRSGRLDAEGLLRLVPDLASRDAMMCGPLGMMSALTPTWTDAGLSHRLKTERFVAAPRSLVPARAPTGKVSLALAGRTVEADGGATLLDQLEAAGERPASGCRMGICNTCVCRKRAGVVENVVTGELSTEPDEDIRLCVSRARTNVELAL